LNRHKTSAFLKYSNGHLKRNDYFAFSSHTRPFQEMANFGDIWKCMTGDWHHKISHTFPHDFRVWMSMRNNPIVQMILRSVYEAKA
jgi:hypothetical protein